MAFENFPESNRTETDIAPVPQKSNPRNIFTIVLVIALLGTWGYIIWDKNKTKEKDTAQQNLIVSTSNQRDELQKELEDATMLYDNLKTTNSRKDSAITSKDREIEEKKARIQALLSNVNAKESELKEARGLIASLHGDIEGYRKQIEVLEGEKVQLTQEKALVTEERNKVQRDFDSARSVIKTNQDIIDVGSTLHASNFNIVGINEKGSKEKETSTAKRVDKLRISFDLDENLIAQSGKKDIYICITSPNGSPVAVEALGSGKFTTREGQDKIYTQKIEVNYTQNKRQSISFDWKQNSDFSTGDYKIEVYNNGFKVGEASKPLKKGGLFS